MTPFEGLQYLQSMRQREKIDESEETKIMNDLLLFFPNVVDERGRYKYTGTL